MLKELIDQFYLDREKDRKQSHFYITDAGKCPRAIFFKFKNAPRKDIEARILRMFDHGDHIHQLIMRALFEARNVHVVASEINIPPQEIISGRADAIVSVDNKLYVLDIKSMNSMIFNKLKEPKEENVYQVQLYLHFFGVKNGILLYVNKDTQGLKEFQFPYDKKIAEGILRGMEKLKKKIDKNIIPPALEDWPNNWQCRYCQFKKICRLAGKDEIKWADFIAEVKKKGKTI